MNYADIRPIDVANGPGVRVSLFVSGCTHHCEGCFNPETWDFQYGKPFGPEQEEEILSALARPYIHGLSLGAAAAVCAIIAYWDKLAQLGSCAKTKIQRTACASEYDDYEE